MPVPDHNPPSVPVTEDLLAVCREIAAAGRTADQWAEIEADDWFQRGALIGGYDATEEAFTFTHRAADGGDLWFQVTLSEVERILSGEITHLDARLAD